MTMMEAYTKSIIAFQKAAFESSFNVVSTMQEVAGRTIQASLAQMPWVPDDGKYMVEHWLGSMHEGRETLKKAVCETYDQIAENFGRQVSQATMQMTESAREMTREAVLGSRQMAETARQGFEMASGSAQPWNRPEEQEPGIRESQESRGAQEQGRAEQGTSRGKLRLNKAEREDLAGLFGIGEATADKIVSYIEKSGPIKDWDELEEIPGIKSSIITRLKEECSL
jgi:DNA uptake protein ComE-like DNA-binding protein